MTHPLTPTQQETRVNENPIYGFGTLKRDAPAAKVAHDPADWWKEPVWRIGTFLIQAALVVLMTACFWVAIVALPRWLP